MTFGWVLSEQRMLASYRTWLGNKLALSSAMCSCTWLSLQSASSKPLGYKHSMPIHPLMRRNQRGCSQVGWESDNISAELLKGGNETMTHELHSVLPPVVTRGPFLLTGKGGESSLSGEGSGPVRSAAIWWSIRDLNSRGSRLKCKQMTVYCCNTNSSFKWGSLQPMLIYRHFALCILKHSGVSGGFVGFLQW